MIALGQRHQNIFCYNLILSIFFTYISILYLVFSFLINFITSMNRPDVDRPTIKEFLIMSITKITYTTVMAAVESFAN